MSGISKFIEQLKQFWLSRSGSQRAFLVGGAVVTVAMVRRWSRSLMHKTFLTR
jgi:hypothetical protein